MKKLLHAINHRFASVIQRRFMLPFFTCLLTIANQNIVLALPLPLFDLSLAVGQPESNEKFRIPDSALIRLTSLGHPPLTYEGVTYNHAVLTSGTIWMKPGLSFRLPSDPFVIIPNPLMDFRGDSMLGWNKNVQLQSLIFYMPPQLHETKLPKHFVHCEDERQCPKDILLLKQGSYRHPRKEADTFKGSDLANLPESSPMCPEDQGSAIFSGSGSGLPLYPIHEALTCTHDSICPDYYFLWIDDVGESCQRCSPCPTDKMTVRWIECADVGLDRNYQCVPGEADFPVPPPLYQPVNNHPVLNETDKSFEPFPPLKEGRSGQLRLSPDTVMTGLLAVVLTAFLRR